METRNIEISSYTDRCLVSYFSLKVMSLLLEIEETWSSTCNKPFGQGHKTYQFVRHLIRKLVNVLMYFHYSFSSESNLEKCSSLTEQKHF